VITASARTSSCRDAPIVTEAFIAAKNAKQNSGARNATRNTAERRGSLNPGIL
jgi:hypothetical protein